MENNQVQYFDKIIHISRVAKVVKGGKRFSFSALIVVGDKEGKIGIAVGKGKEVPSAVRKGIEKAKKKLVKIYLNGGTIPHPVTGHFGAGLVLLKPAYPGTGIIAGGPVRTMLEVLGITDVLAKSLGTNNPHNLVRATMEGLLKLRSREKILSLRKEN